MKMPPPEVPIDRATDDLAPQFWSALEAVLSELGDAKISETVRTPARQSFLYGFGRDYDDGRGVVTNAANNLTSWHGYGLAADIIHVTKDWDAGSAWFVRLGECAERHGLKWGGRWKHPDLPHVQWGKCKDSPSDEARAIYAQGGAPAVWIAVAAN